MDDNIVYATAQREPLPVDLGGGHSVAASRLQFVPSASIVTQHLTSRRHLVVHAHKHSHKHSFNGHFPSEPQLTRWPLFLLSFNMFNLSLQSNRLVPLPTLFSDLCVLFLAEM